MNKNLDLRLNFVPLSCRLLVILSTRGVESVVDFSFGSLSLYLSFSAFFSCFSNSHSHFYSLPFYQSLKLLFVVPVSCPIFSFQTFIFLFVFFPFSSSFPCSTAFLHLYLPLFFTSCYYFFYSSNFLSILFRLKTWSIIMYLPFLYSDLFFSFPLLFLLSR